MVNIKEIEESFRNLTYSIKSFIMARKREEACITAGAFLLWVGINFVDWLQVIGLKGFFQYWHGDTIGRVFLFTASSSLFLYAAVKIFKLVYVRDLPPPTDRPSAIKGPRAFTEEDGALFRKLGRENDLQKLLGFVLDKQVPMVIVRGSSGAGKTSLLRAGLSNILSDQNGRNVSYHYWEATPTEPEEALLHAIRETWPDGLGKPSTLDNLINPTDDIGRQEHIIVLDQFEQMRGNKFIFRLVRKIAREAKPPHRITWVIAFRREFSADWMDFISPEQERGMVPPPDLAIQLFTVEQARDVISQIIKEIDISIEQMVVNNLINSATVESKISPVEIGIGLLALSELFELNGRNTITIKDYQFMGGAEGLLTQYIKRCLNIFPEEEQKNILKALLALCNPETRTRVAEGLTIEELAKEGEAETHRLKWQFDRLEKRDTRLIETVSVLNGTLKKYRLSHERLVSAIYRLTGKLLSEVELANSIFENAFLAWKNNGEVSRYLMKGKDLRLVERNKKKIPSDKSSKEKKVFLERSKQKRFSVRSIILSVFSMLLVSAWYANISYQAYQRRIHAENLIRESGYPAALYNWQHQLKVLELSKPLDLQDLSWLSSNSIQELTFKSTNTTNSISGIASLARCSLLKKLTLDLDSSQVTDLTPITTLNNIRDLTINLSKSRVRNLEPLAKLSNLNNLRINLSDSEVRNLEPLAKLSNLKNLAIHIDEKDVRKLESLTKNSNLRNLTINLTDKKVRMLEPLFKLSNLHNLRINYNYSKEMHFEPLTQLSNLQALSINLGITRVKNLEPLVKFSNLSSLSIDLRISDVSSLEPLSKFSKLSSLSVDLGYSQVSSLEPLAELLNLSSLSIDLESSQVKNLEPLVKLSKLNSLSIDLGEHAVSVLEPIPNYLKLHSFSFDLSLSDVSNLEYLEKFSGIRYLTIRLNINKVSNLKPLERLSNINNLSIYLNNNKASNLSSLEKLSNLHALSIYLSASDVSNIELLAKLPIKKLIIKLGYSVPILQSIPRNLEELRFLEDKY